MSALAERRITAGSHFDTARREALAGARELDGTSAHHFALTAIAALDDVMSAIAADARAERDERVRFAHDDRLQKGE